MAHTPQLPFAAPLAGVRVLEVATMLAGPFGAAMLGDMGADVIKIEPPCGDESRGIGPGIGNDSGFFVGVNRNKRGIVVDLSKPEGREIFYRLVRTADILVENVRHRAKRKLGVTYEEVSGVKPGIIVISVSAFGQDGPSADRPGIDCVAQAFSGLMGITGEKGGRPLRAGAYVADATCANLVAFAAMLGLWVRGRDGIGQRIGISLIDGMIHLQPSQVGQFFLSGFVQPRLGNSSPFYAPYGTFRCRDGREIQIAAFNDRFFKNLCKAIGRDDLAGDPRFRSGENRLAREEELNEIIQGCFSAKDSKEMMRALIEADVMASPVNGYPETFADPQVRHNLMAVEVDHARAGRIRVGGVPVKLNKTPGSVRRAPPALGQHTGEVLEELGIPRAEIEKLNAAGIVRLG